jgi:hypothetical protein
VRRRKAGAIRPVKIPTFHATYDVLLTPALATSPPKARHLPAEAVRGLRGANVVVETTSGTYIVGTKSGRRQHPPRANGLRTRSLALS